MSKSNASRAGLAGAAGHAHAVTCPPEVSRVRALSFAIGMIWALAMHPAPTCAAPLKLSAIAAGHGGFIIDGEASWATSLATAGDVNGDGLTDVIVGAPFGGRIYVVFGKSGTTAVNLSDVGQGIGGFLVDGSSVQDLAGWTVAGVGDVNGDGLGDLIVDAPGEIRTINEGDSYIVFGKTDTDKVDLAELQQAKGGGFVIHQDRLTYYPCVVAAAGDVNGDGLADLLVGRPADPFYGYGGIAFVVFGKTSSSAVQTDEIENGVGGFAVFGHFAAGNTVDGVGDVNGDGLADVTLGWAKSPYDTREGRTYVVFGRTDTASLDVTQLDAGIGGFVIRGTSAGDYSGASAAGAGDVNGDGLADVIVSSPGIDPRGRDHVVFGKKTTEPVALADVTMGIGGFVIGGDGAGSTGGRVAGVGDIDGDGLGDVILGPDGADRDHALDYVVHGQTGTSAIALSAVAAGIGGFAIRGEFGSTTLLAGGADFNGDGLSDLLVSAPEAGRAYVIFGATSGAFKGTEVDQLGDSGDDTLTGTTKSNVFVGGAGEDTFVANGGADVLYGGLGDDVFLLKSSNVKALFSKFGINGNTEHLARLDGGAGFDTMRVVGAGIHLDLVKTANQGGGGKDSTSRIESIERIDLTGTGDNTLSIGVRDVQDMAAMNLINSGTQGALGWTNGTYAFPSRVGRHQLVVDGDAGDVVDLGPAANGWESAGTVFSSGVRYDVYNSNTKPAPSFERVQVIVAHAVTVVAPARRQ